MAFIEAKDYRFFYPDEVEPAVFVEQMEIKQGTITLLVGPSGCGKTTLLRKLAGETGIRGREEGSLINQAKGCAYVWQNPDNQIVTDRVSYEIVFGLENIGMEQQQMKRRLAEVISSFGLEKSGHAGHDDIKWWREAAFKYCFRSCHESGTYDIG